MVDKVPCAVSTSVSKPEKHGSGRSAVTDYLVTTSFDGGESKTNESLVRRTFEDFLWVQERLVKERMGIIIPILAEDKPPKNSSHLSDFLTVRQERLDRFLQRVIRHPELVGAPCLFPFFTANPTDWIATKESSKTNADKDLLLKENTNSEDDVDVSADDTIEIDAHAAMHDPELQKKKGPLGRWFSNKRTEWALKKENLDLEETPAETNKFGDMKTYADHLEVCVRILSEDFQKIQESNAVVAEKTGTMGAAFAQMWGEHDLSNTSSSALYQTLGKAWANVGDRIQNHISFGDRHFQNPVDDLIMDVVALKDALAQRKASVYAYTKLTHEGKKLNKQLDRIRQSGNMAAQQDRFYKLESQLRYCDERTTECRTLSELVTTRLERDIDRFRVEWHETMRQVLESFHKQQLKFFEFQTKDFTSVLPALMTLDSKRSDLATINAKSEELNIDFSVNTGGAKAVIVERNSDSVVGQVPPPATAPPAAIEEEQSPSPAQKQSIPLDASYSSDDGFGADSAAMGGESSETKPVLRSV
eukprot:CAMPEP_0197186908 /NCGR_PEP_ID=MMETSP1423-20130617/14847_1 /TAXON_ID=476441 /ORGANISM="Pseudo-nitzschia heimii, Strain UNC1101" /LENGTH=531 /DNA_ID=CAMNT_0042638345 /DNA_START=84 /DNA_END=1679 /DNA_ORIENTATION=-